MSWGGNLIKIARLDAKQSQRELAKRAATSQAALSAYERGHKSPSLDTVARIVRAAGQDLRIQVMPYDDHDDVVAEWEATLSGEQRAAIEVQRKALRAAAARPVRELTAP